MSHLIDERRLDRARRRARQPSWAPCLARLRQRTDELAASALRPPATQAGFYHGYFCPEHAVELTFDPDQPTAHCCPVGGDVFSGEPYDSAWRWFVNNRLSTGAFEFALLWQLEGDVDGRRQAIDILTGYAGWYADYGLSDRPHGRGRATFQSLDESVWLIALTRAYDLVRDDATAAERDHIESRLLRPAAEHITSERFHSIHNIECWHNAALAAVGHRLGDDGMVGAARDDAHGFLRQLDEGVRVDGLWWEGSSSYHFYALWALVSHVLVSEVADPGLHDHERLRSMFRTPVDLATPDDRLPGTNDCWLFSSLTSDVCHGVPPAAGFYEVACGWYGDPAFAAVLARNYRSRPRDLTESLLYGDDRLPPAAETPDAGCVNFEPSGLAVLRSGGRRERQSHLVLKYGPHGGGHGHPDKLSVSLTAAGEAIAVDLGTPGYGIGLNDTWFRQTISHNTVVVDGTSQPPAQGRLRHFDDGAAMAYAVADAEVSWSDGAYAGVEMRRIVLWRDRYFVDLFQVRCPDPRQLDWVCRLRGERSTETQALHGDAVDTHLSGEGYEHIFEAATVERSTSVRLGWRWAGGGVDLFLPDEADTQLLLGTAPHNPSSEDSDILLRRRNRPSTLFAAVVHPWTGEASVHGVEIVDSDAADAVALAVDTVDGREAWLVGPGERLDRMAALAADTSHRYEL